MTTSPLRIVVVEEDSSLRALLVDVLQQWGHDCRACPRPGDARPLLESSRMDALILGAGCPASERVRLLEDLSAYRPDAAVIVLVPSGGTAGTAGLVGEGADEVLPVPFTLDLLAAALEAARARRERSRCDREAAVEMRAEITRLREEVRSLRAAAEGAEEALLLHLGDDPRAFCLADAGSREILGVSRGLEALLGISRHEAAGARVESLLASGDVEALLSGAGDSGLRLRRRGQDSASVAARASRLRGAGARVLVELVEEGCAETESPPMTTGETARLLSHLSHEFRTPLAAIIGHTDLLELIHGGLGERQARSVERIRVNAQYLLHLANQLLDLSRLQMGRLDIEHETVALRELIDDVVTTLAPLADEKGISLHADAGPDAPVLVTDGARARQILLNLAGNAIKYTREGSVVISAGWADRESDTARICVKDTGIGIDADRLGDLFGEFRVLHSRREAPERGSGLGLAISQRVARSLGGDIAVASEKGAGSTFTLTLPDMRVRAAEEPARTA